MGGADQGIDRTSFRSSSDRVGVNAVNRVRSIAGIFVMHLVLKPVPADTPARDGCISELAAVSDVPRADPRRRHTNTNLPVVLAGGGYQHGEHRAYPASGLGRVPLCNLYVSLLQRFGVEIDRFGIGTGTMRGLELA